MSRYIDADKAYEIASNHKDFEQSIADLVSLKEVLDDTPTDDVAEGKHGYWVYNRGQAFGEPCYFCSLCIDGGSNNGRDNYCPNCGAKMDGERKDEE